MKNILLSLVLLAPSTLLYANTQAVARAPLTPQENRLLNTLYWNNKNAASFAQGLTATELNYAIYVVLKQIQILQHTMLPENSWKRQIELIVASSLVSIMYGGLGYMGAYDTYTKHSEFISGKFKNAFISKSTLNNLSSIRFSLKEKKYLRRFKAENILIGESSSWISFWEKERSQEILSKMSRRNKEKIKYCALKETINAHKKQLLQDAFVPALFIAAAVAMFSTCLYGVIYYKETLHNELEICQTLDSILNNEIERRFHLTSSKA